LKDVPGGVVSPKGFRASTAQCGIKHEGRPDLVLIVSERPSRCAGVFTTNRVKAAPVLLSRDHAARGSASAVIANSGNANACNGEAGLECAAAMATETARLLAIDPYDVLVASTGVIGRPFPIEKVLMKLPGAVTDLSCEYSPIIARSIMTTDTVPKEASCEFDLGGVPVRIGAMAKGAGMIRPDMATMLCFVTTDADISQNALKSSLLDAVERSFNSITIDGDMSTNDTVLLIANGRAGNITVRSRTKNHELFTEALTDVCRKLAQAVVRDGEGATKFVTIQVAGAASRPDARQVAFAIANSPLVKTALFGCDPNWGRIICAAGYSGVPIKEANVKIAVNDAVLFENGEGVPFDEPTLRNSMAAKEIEITIDLGMGRSGAIVYTTDLSYEYIKINAEYTT
jgi:glutamate N-acetyltransferase / amino-acid N-acetyltransferase